VTAADILSTLAHSCFDCRKSTLLPGSLWGDHTLEKDLLVLGGGRKPKLTEVEIKISLSDWKRDAQKTTNRYRQHLHGFTYVRKYEAIANQSYLSGMLSRFYIACPRGLWEVARGKLDEQALPPWAGVLSVLDHTCDKDAPPVITEREAKVFDAQPLPEGARAEFHRLCYFRFWSQHYQTRRLDSVARDLSEASRDYTDSLASAWAALSEEREKRLKAESQEP
jgi:hypothetical protein